MAIIRRLDFGEELLYRSIRLESLRESPEAFSSQYADAVARSDESWTDQANASAAGSDRVTLIAFEEQAVGLAALYRDEEEPDVGELIQMWVAPEVRGGQVATNLLDEIFRWAGSHRFLRVKAEVMNNNARALKFYENYGFTASADASQHSTTSVVLTKPVA
ncbi:GNAT family N-acetyltransferase [Verrucomicrobiaceae bacterium 227]